MQTHKPPKSLTIGLTYDLRSEYLAEGFSEEETAEFDRDDTVTAIETTIRSLGYQTERIGHGRQLAAALAAGRRWDLVFNIAEGLRGIFDETAGIDHDGFGLSRVIRKVPPGIFQPSNHGFAVNLIPGATQTFQIKFHGGFSMFKDGLDKMGK